MNFSQKFKTEPKPKKKLNVLPENPEKKTSCSAVSAGRFPSWLHRKMPKGQNLFNTHTILRKHKLNTVCEEAKCPNRSECYTKKTATFLALGKECTRNCGFCDIDFNKSPKLPEEDEPARIALSVKDLGLKHVVITMVARDDLPDKGASHIGKIIDEIRKENSTVTIEVLLSDLSGSFENLQIVLDKKPEVFNHNIETVKELTPRVRHKASYERTLKMLQFAKESNLCRFVKSGIMVGLGETPDQVKETICDLHKSGCEIITIGQYLQPNRKKLLVKEFVHPDQFKEYEKFGLSIGVKHMYSGPFVRSSYNAHLFV